MSQHLVRFCFALLCVAASASAQAFCGFYVGKAGTDLFNEASKVVLVRDENRTVLTMVNDYEGELTEFAMVVPVPTVLEEGQIHIGNSADVDHLDAYTAPRMVEYFDEDPCAVMRYKTMMLESAMIQAAPPTMDAQSDLGVTIEAEYTVGEYDIVILSAEQSDGLSTWLIQNNYKIPTGAEKVLGSYIKQGTKFFVAKVNLEAQQKTGLQTLRPLQIAFESRKFMLPIRLGTVNSKGMQDLFVFTLTKQGRVETSNYRTVKIPSDIEVPLYVQDKFQAFYSDVFETAWNRERGKAVFLEYAWDMNWCDPCAADPLSHEQLRNLGVYWLDSSNQAEPPRFKSQARDVFVTRLHLRYNGDLFPEDLMLQQTSDRSNFQGRYVTRHPWKGKAECEAAKNYQTQLPRRHETQAQNLANISGWDIQQIRDTMSATGQVIESEKPSKPKWWLQLWK